MRFNEKMPQSGIKAACALIESPSKRGTGFLISPDLVLTCAHVVDNGSPSDSISVRFYDPDVSVSAKIEKLENSHDIALLILERSINDRPTLIFFNKEAKIPSNASFISYGFPSVNQSTGLLINGHIQDIHGQEPWNRKEVLVLYSNNATPGAQLDGFSGSPVIFDGKVIGQLKQIIPDENNRATMGIIYATPAYVLSDIVPKEIDIYKSTRKAYPIPGASYNSTIYISRPKSERKAWDYLKDPGSPTVLWGPDHFGKTWLMEHLITLFRKRYPSCQIARINFDIFSQQPQATYENFLEVLAKEIVCELHKPERFVEELWSRNKLPNRNLSFIIEMLLEQCNSSNAPLLLAFDRADRLLRYNYHSDFFSLLRYWAQNVDAPWPRLRLLLSISTSPHRLSTNVENSPFQNLSVPIELEPFSLEQMIALAEAYGLRWPRDEINHLAEWLGGHPYLVGEVMYDAALNDRQLNEIMEEPPGAIRRYLRKLRGTLNRDLLDTLSKIVREPDYRLAENTYETLYQAGLIVRIYQNKCAIYRLRGTIYKDI